MTASHQWIEPGDQFITLSGRHTTPFPKYSKSSSKSQSTKDEKAIRRWLKDNAIDEAAARGDTFTRPMWRALDPANWSPSDGDAVNEYLFGDPTGRICSRRVANG